MTDEPAGAGVRIALRPIANPLPLGFLALAVGTLVLAGLQLEWIDPSEQRQVALGVIVFVAPLQLLASVLSFLARDVAAGTGMGILAGTWAAIGLILRCSSRRRRPPPRRGAGRRHGGRRRSASP
jgi:succinate-acetate transporter protein